MPPLMILVERKGVERCLPSTDVESGAVVRVVLRNVEPGSIDSFTSKP